MKSSRNRAALAIAATLLLSVGLTGCGTNAPASAPASSAAAAAPAPTPADLSGEWKQTNSKSADSYQSATITADTIEVNWVSDGGNTTALYWAGTYTAPTKAGAFSWVSANDTARTSASMLASGDATKTFTYDNGVISYKVSALGVTTTVQLGRK